MNDTHEPLKFYTDDSGEHRWKLTAANGEIVGASSKGFSSKAAAVNNFLLMITMGSAEIARVVRNHQMFQ